MKVIVQPVGLLLLASLSLLGCTAVAAVPSDQDSAGKLSSEISSVAHERAVRSAQACSISCTPGSSGLLGTLTVHVMRAENLPDTDGLFSGDSDPYTRVTALQGAGVLSTTRETSTIGGTENPVWNQALHFGCGEWRFIDVSVWDSDSGGDDLLMPVKRFPICNSGRCSITYVNSGSILYFDVEVNPRQPVNECSSSNPCLNAGTCVDTPCSFSCNCLLGFEGDRCQDSQCENGQVCELP